MKILKLAASILASAITALTLTSCAAAPTDTVTVRLWDQNVAEAYRESFAEFTNESGIKVKVKVIPWSDYWSQLRVDLASGAIDDIFWVNAGNFEEYAKQGLLRKIEKSDFNFDDWDSAVINQYTAANTLWGVPQLSDPGIGLYYNKDLLDKYGVQVSDIESLNWDPTKSSDSLRTITQKLTRDSAGRSAADSTFDKARVTSYGFNAAFDLNAILLNFLGSNGAAWQAGDKFVFDSAKGVQTFQYLSDLINKYRVSPPATDTNPPAGGDLCRDLFIQGKLALFESGAYNLANIQTGAKFNWGIARIPAGPAGPISVTNGIVAAASAKSPKQAEQLKVLQWLGGKGASFLGKTGSALTAVKSARNSFFDYWSAKRVDVSPMIDVLSNGYVQAPRGAKYGEAEAAYLPILTELFNGKLSVSKALTDAQVAANKAMGN